MIANTWKSDLGSGFLVFLIALPLCLGISMASGFPPTAGILTAVIGGMLVSFLGSARLTIKGPAVGLIVIALGAVTDLGAGDNILGYKRAIAAGVIAGLIQIVFALRKASSVGDLMPSSVVHGMLAAIGIIIISKQAHIAMGVTPLAKEPLPLLAEIPHSILNLNPAVFCISALSLLILFGLPVVKLPWVGMVPGPLAVLLTAVPLGLLFDLEHEHNYYFSNHLYHLGPDSLVRLPGSLASTIAFPDFSAILSFVSIKYIILFALVGSMENLLSVSAVDSLDPEQRASDMNKDLLATGVGNTLAAALGGLPMISEIVRSKVNIDAGAKSSLSNVFHGAFLLLSLALVPALLQKVPLAALAAMLIYASFRLASAKEFLHVYRIGVEQLLLFVTTVAVTLATGLLTGACAGLLLKLVLHLKNGARLSTMFQAIAKEERRGDELILHVHEAAIFTNFLALRARLRDVEDSVRKVVVDFDNAWVVDHTVLERLRGIERTWTQRKLMLTGLGGQMPMSSPQLAGRSKAHPAVAA
ncbi:MAG TPA: SulP family inorganic anion transporter [Bryobacteraceae bacterium]|nr:SulP family inorganic anion transporter [Bryobacteraceae bacterium]